MLVQTGRFRTARERAGMVEPPAVDPDPHVRAHLMKPLFDWCLGCGLKRSAKLNQVFSDRGTRMCVAVGIAAATVDDLRKQVAAEHDLLIDMADWLIRDSLRSSVSPYDVGQANERLAALGAMLESGGSAWKVDRSPPGLSLRVSNAERDAFAQATSVDDPATAYLREAWSAAWGVTKNGDLAHAKAVNALEAAFRREVTPRDDSASLGVIARDLRVKPEKLSARFDDARPQSDERRRPHAGALLLEKSLGIIFAANHRHAGADEHVKNSLDDGRDAVTLAAALIAMQRRGFLKRISKEQ